MARNIRNFWIDTQVDGRARVQKGPQAKDGGFQVTIYIRDEGCTARAVEINGFARGDGTLALEVIPRDKVPVIEGNRMVFVTERD